MIIEGEVTDGVSTLPFTSIWKHNPDDPLVVTVDFVDHAVWLFSLELFREALTAPSERLHGVGDVKIEVIGESTLLYLNNGVHSSTLKLPTSGIREFLGQVDDSGSEEVIARELDEFLWAL